MTKCKPIQKENCVKVPREVIEQKTEKQCLPFELSQAELEASANIDPCLQQGFVADFGHDQHGTTAGYGGKIFFLANIWL